jgi:hypothetical protein
MVVYPVRGSALVNQMHLSSSPAEAQKAYDRIQDETKRYNEQVANGKWRHIMSSNPRNRPALRKPDATARTESKTSSESETGPARNGFVCFEAEHPSRSTAGTGTDWKVIRGLGRSGDSIALLPTTTSVPAGAALEYDFTVENSGDANVVVYCIPTQPIHPGLKLRYSVSLDSNQAGIVDAGTAENSRTWSENVLRAAAIGTIGPIPAQPGKHTLKLQPLDPGLVFDKVVVDLGGLKPSHLGPPETRAIQRAD